MYIYLSIWEGERGSVVYLVLGHAGGAAMSLSVYLSLMCRLSCGECCGVCKYVEIEEPRLALVLAYKVPCTADDATSVCPPRLHM
jgi:hypothetical protein